MGRGCCYCGHTALQLRPNIFLHFSLCPVVGVSLHGVSLFRERLMEHQRNFTQPHSQSVLQVPDFEPALQRHGIGDAWDFSNLL